VRVLLLEREAQPGYHSTGRSAALFMESYGPPQVRALTCASRAFFDAPPPGFCDHPLLAPRGALAFALAGGEAALDAHEALVRSVTDKVERWSAARTLACVPVLRPEGLVGGVHEPDACDIDVHALHYGFLNGTRAAGCRLVLDADLRGLHRRGGAWDVDSTQGRFRAPVIVNAAGAWADDVGALAGARPVGLVAKRRSAFTFAPPAGIDGRAWPLFMDVAETFYVKPDAGMLLASPANADPVPPHDVQAEELDVASAIDAIERMTTLTIRRPHHVWAGLRSFVPDGELVLGFDPVVPGFFWAAGQGGYGIQSAPAAGAAAACLVRGIDLPGALLRRGVDPAAMAPGREFAVPDEPR
jgi:D-arginine dehydrogenase